MKINHLGVRFCIRDDCKNISGDRSDFCEPCLAAIANSGVLEDHLRAALDRVLLNTHASTWGRSYSISKEDDRKACIDDLLERLIIPMLKEMGPSLAKEGFIPDARWGN